jgi:hypothetical protein
LQRGKKARAKRSIINLDGGFMKKVMKQVKLDLVKLRSMLPMNDYRAKGIIKRINWAIAEILKEEKSETRAEVVW